MDGDSCNHQAVSNLHIQIKPQQLMVSFCPSHRLCLHAYKFTVDEYFYPGRYSNNIPNKVKLLSSQ